MTDAFGRECLFRFLSGAGQAQEHILQGLPAGPQISERVVLRGEPSREGSNISRRRLARHNELTGLGRLDAGTHVGGKGGHVEIRRTPESDSGLFAAGHQFLGAPVGDDFPVVDDQNAIAQPFGLVEIVGGQHDTDPFVAKLVDDVAHHQACGGIDAGGGFVEERDLRPPDDRERERKSLLLAAGKSTPGRRRNRGQPDAFQERIGILRSRPVIRCEQPHRISAVHRDVDPVALQHDADAGSEPLRVFAGVEAKNACNARRRYAVALQRLDRGGLSGPVGAEQRQDAPGVLGERNPVDRRYRVGL
jgi:hypothetical protein